MADFTLGTAAKRLGLSKPTVSKYLKEGKISGQKLDDGSYRIDGAELARFEAGFKKPAGGKRQGEAPTAKRSEGSELQIARVELMAAQTRITELEGDRDRLRADLVKAQDRIDKMQDQLAQIAQAQVERGQVPWWQRMIGKE